MNEERFMIIIKGDDKTKDVSSYEIDPPIVRIVYRGSCKEYTYLLNDVRILEPTVLNITKDMAVFHDEYPFYNVKRVLDFGPKIRVCFGNGSIRTYDRERIQIKHSSTRSSEANRILNYWRAISKHVENDDVQENKEAFLAKEFAKLNYIDPDSALSHYLLKHPN
ncbi:hypothetical protein G8C92_11055 [Paenibacillus donghaensis]|uniref:hypothetical protein n=1 Tax=Paenibacillus donghaensis TaxID=414771 RepID=UPI0018847D22|nr:hypothetical protein [Paenibacillus donghaensis]MBE9914569.1 hypothetical protein [Paenibacillus donghaensis]